MATWLIPDNFADILPNEARTLERMRRTCLDLFAVHGFEPVRPPLVEFVGSLLTGSGSDLDNSTFKFMDQANGRMVGLRADITPQTARIDAHILNRKGVSRLCYAASCLHARPMHPLASREPVVAGAELFGVSSFEADAEIMTLAVTALRRIGLTNIHMDIGHTGIVRAIIGDVLTGDALHALVRALRMKDPVALEAAAAPLPAESREALQVLLRNFGGIEVLDILRAKLPKCAEISAALDEVAKLSRVCGADEVSFDFCDVHGYQYLTGITFAVNVPQYAQAILRGGRYDGVGMAFGRSRPACGFTIYLRALASVGITPADEHPEAIIAAGGYDCACQSAYESEVEKLREEGRIVVRLLPGENPADVASQFNVTHELVCQEDGTLKLVTVEK